MADSTRSRRSRDPVLVGTLWMVGVSLALFFLPAINGFIGGIIGGYKVGGFKRALAAAILPSIGVGIGLWVLLALFDLPIIGVLSGAAVGLWALFSSIGLLVGAAAGGTLAETYWRGRLPA